MAALVEPRVLLAAKEYLLPDGAMPGYAVVDAQFQVDSWGKTSIPGEVREGLRPINTLRMAAGYPDALVAPPRPDAYREATDRSEHSLPVAVVEAKGLHSDPDGSVDRNATRIGITQAHAHLGETNVGYAAVPSTLVRPEDRALARELNVGLLAVDGDRVELLERPRLVGTDATPTIETVRFHGSLGGSPVENFTKNHPKNALGYALAIQHGDDPGAVFERYVIRSVEDARRDAIALGLVSGEPQGDTLTPTGCEVVRTIAYHYDGTTPALKAIDSQTGSSARFIDELPVMGTLARQTLLTYPPTQVLIDVLRELAADGVLTPTLAELAKAVARKRPDFALDLFVSTEADARDRVLSEDQDGTLELDAFDVGTVYSTHTTFQYKAMLFHCGLLTERGHDKKSELDPTRAIWALETPLLD
jgi:hypothetical protein